MTDLPRYRCHKVVRAAKITRVYMDLEGFAMLSFELSGLDDRQVCRSYIEKHQPERGGYFVLYQDGYESYSPAEAFEAGYTRIVEDDPGVMVAP